MPSLPHLDKVSVSISKVGPGDQLAGEHAALPRGVIEQLRVQPLHRAGQPQRPGQECLSVSLYRVVLHGHLHERQHVLLDELVVEDVGQVVPGQLRVLGQVPAEEHQRRDHGLLHELRPQRPAHLQYSTVQYSTVQYSTLQYSTV